MAVNRDDVARRAGVSGAVVSYVVNNGPRYVSPELRQRVEDAMRDLGYRPNAMARALKTRSTDLIALLVPEHGNPFLDELARSVASHASLMGKGMILATPKSGDESLRRTIDSVLTRRVDALFIVSREWPEGLEQEHLGGTPLVILDAARDLTEGMSVGVDDSIGAEIAVAHLVEHRRTRIGCIFSPTLPEREQAWRNALNTREMIAEHMSASGPVSRLGGYKACLQLFSGDHEPPDALYISTDIQAIGALRALSELGLQAPRDVAIVSFDDSEPASYSVPALTSVSQKIDEITDGAFLLAFGSGERANIVLHPALAVRESCGCPKASVSAS